MQLRLFFPLSLVLGVNRDPDGQLCTEMCAEYLASCITHKIFHYGAAI
jgi:hypothetical protein